MSGNNKETVNYRHILQRTNFSRKSLLYEVLKQLLCNQN